jgi:hypothetical protein
MHLTDYHAKYFAFELTKRCPSDSVEKLASVLADAQVDLNPHQVGSRLDEIGQRLQQKLEQERLFTIRWRLT